MEPGPESQDEPTPTPMDDGLVNAVRSKLVAAGRVDTVEGQLALQLARKLADVDATGVSGLSKELRAVLTEALKGAEQPGPSDEAAAASSEPVEDEVTRARRAREEARKAAGLT